MHKKSLNIIWLLICCLQSQVAYSMKRKREVPSLKELALQASENRIKKDIKKKYKNSSCDIKEELQKISEEFHVQVVSNYFNTFIEKLEDLELDPKMELYLELVPQFKVSYDDLCQKFGENEIEKYMYIEGKRSLNLPVTFCLSNIQDMPILVDLIDLSKEDNTVSEHVKKIYGNRENIVKIYGNTTQELLSKFFQKIYNTTRWSVDEINIFHTNLTHIPEEVGNFKTHTLRIFGNRYLKSLPVAIRNMINLKNLCIHGNISLSEISDQVITKNIKNLQIDKNTKGLFSKKITSYFYKEQKEKEYDYLINIDLVRNDESLPHHLFYDRFFPTTYNKHVSISLILDQIMHKINGYQMCCLMINNISDIIDRPVLFDQALIKIDRFGIGSSRVRLCNEGKKCLMRHLIVNGNILPNQLQSLLQRNKYISELTIKGSSIELLPEELGNIEELQRLDIVNVPNVQMLPDSFKNLLCRKSLYTITFDEHMYDLIPEELKEYMPIYEKKDGILIIHPINPLIHFGKEIEDQELEVIRQSVNEAFSPLMFELKRDIIEKYLNTILSDKDIEAPFFYDPRQVKLGDTAIKKDLLLQVYLEKLIELNSKLSIDLQKFVTIAYPIEEYNSCLVSDLPSSKNILLLLPTDKIERYKDHIQKMCNFQNIEDVFDYIVFKPILYTDKIEENDDISLEFKSSNEVGYYISDEELYSCLDAVDNKEYFLDKVKALSFDGVCLENFNEELIHCKNVEIIRFLNSAIKSNSNLWEHIKKFEKLKRIDLYSFEDYPGLFEMESYWSNTIAEHVFDMPNLEKIIVTESLFNSLPDDFKERIEIEQMGPEVYEFTLK